MKIIYISALGSKKKINDEYQRSGNNPGFAIQKFSRLLVKGLQANGADVLAFSNPPNSDMKRRFVVPSEEDECGILYKYVPYINIPILKHICVFLYTFFYIFFWGIKKNSSKAIICDVLSISICLGALLASKLNRVLSVGVVTDIYGLMAGKKGILMGLASKLNSCYVSAFDKYVLLTEQMNEKVNPYGKPYIVMEALCDNSLSTKIEDNIKKNHPRTVIYAGGIHEKYGLKMLAEGFIEANVKDAKLVYYGSGPYVEEYKTLCAKNPNLEYRGVATNDVVMTEELKATLLVNPRFTTEELTKYSFPSKNMEYMASGTPLLTTKLPGMPEEYNKYVFLFKEETVEGYADAIRLALAHSEAELNVIGCKARQFVLQNKNNVVQGNRVLDLLSPPKKKEYIRIRTQT